jgi:hypothetical protein
MMIPIIGGHAVSRAFAPGIIAKADDRNDRECRECDDNYDDFHIGNLLELSQSATATQNNPQLLDEPPVAPTCRVGTQ